MKQTAVEFLGLDFPFTQIKIELSELHRRLDFMEEQYYNEKFKQISYDYAIEFLEWFDKNAYSRGGNSYLLWDNDKEPLTSKQLLEIFKKEKGL